jgi:hypothetical protein
MANTSEPYRRVGSNSWEELLTQVNDVLENPDGGCDPLEPIETPEDPHLWAKEDIQEVHNRLNEMPGDCFEFAEIPDLWKLSIIEDIEGQLENAWCDCEDKCSNCGPDDDLTSLFLHNWTWRTRGSGGQEETVVDWPALLHWIEVTDDMISWYESAAIDLCFFNMDLHELEKDLDVAESELEAAEADRDRVCAEGPSPACTAAEAVVQEKEAEVEEIEEEIEEVEGYIQESIALRDSSSAAADAAALAGWGVIIAVRHDISGPVDYHGGPPPTPIGQEIFDAIGIQPWHRDDTCTTRFLFPWRCRGWLYL